MTLAAAGALLSTLVVLAVSGVAAGHAAGEHEHAPAPRAATAKQAALHDAMRKLWEQHVAWTRMAIVSFAAAKDAWYANGRQVADFLSAANPRNWPRGAVRAMMKTHLDQTPAEATAQLTGGYAASIREYDAIEDHILEMADTLSRGIVKQFPGRLR